MKTDKILKYIYLDMSYMNTDKRDESYWQSKWVQQRVVI